MRAFQGGEGNPFAFDLEIEIMGYVLFFFFFYSCSTFDRSLSYRFVIKVSLERERGRGRVVPDFLSFEILVPLEIYPSSRSNMDKIIFDFLLKFLFLRKGVGFRNSSLSNKEEKFIIFFKFSKVFPYR